jgi:hypothetical protein
MMQRELSQETRSRGRPRPRGVELGDVHAARTRRPGLRRQRRGRPWLIVPTYIETNVIFVRGVSMGDTRMMMLSRVSAAIPCVRI